MFWLSAVSDNADKNTFVNVVEVETEFENSLECQSGVHMGSKYEKNQRPKIS